MHGPDRHFDIGKALLKDLPFCQLSFLKNKLLHPLREIHNPSRYILRVNRCNHDVLADQKLVLHLPCQSILSIYKGQRAEHHCAGKSGFHILAVKIRKQLISGSDYI